MTGRTDSIGRAAIGFVAIAAMMHFERLSDQARPDCALLGREQGENLLHRFVVAVPLFRAAVAVIEIAEAKWTIRWTTIQPSIFRAWMFVGRVETRLVVGATIRRVPRTARRRLIESRAMPVSRRPAVAQPASVERIFVVARARWTIGRSFR